MRIIATLLISLFIFQFGVSQTLEESSAARSSEMQHKYIFTAGVKDRYSIKVVGDKGQVKQAPMVTKELADKEAIRFSVNTEYWKPGIYHVVASSKKGKTVTKKIYIRRRE